MLEELKKIEEFCNLIEYIISSSYFSTQTNTYTFDYSDYTIETSCIWILDSIKQTINSIFLLIKKYSISDAFDLLRKLQNNILIFMYLWYINTTLNITNAKDNVHYKVLVTWMRGGINNEEESSLNIKNYIKPNKILEFLKIEMKNKEPVEDLFYILNINEEELLENSKFYSEFVHGSKSIYSMNFVWKILLKQNPKTILPIIEKVLILQKLLLLFMVRHRKNLFSNSIGLVPRRPWETSLLLPIKNYFDNNFSELEKQRIKEKTGIL